jgi:cobalt/nickel transport system permease protein
VSDYLDRYGRRQSICHRLPPRAKLLLALTVIAVAVSLPAEYWPVQGAIGCLVFMGHSLAGIPMSYLLRRLALFMPMACMMSISLPAAHAFRGGWELMFTVLFRSTLSFLVGLWLINVMPFDQLLVTLRKLRVPAILVATLAFMYRYVYVLWDELDRMRTARRVRTFGRGSLFMRWKTSAQLIGMLLVRSMARAERVHGAMCARGWDGQVRTLESD